MEEYWNMDMEEGERVMKCCKNLCLRERIGSEGIIMIIRVFGETVVIGNWDWDWDWIGSVDSLLCSDL